MRTAMAEQIYWEPEEDEGLENTLHNLMLDYSRANGTRRLHLWLFHRDLRRDFDAVAEMFEERSEQRPGWIERLKSLCRLKTIQRREP